MIYFIDFEATQFSGEIISMGCVDMNGRQFYSLVRPAALSEMTDFTVELTGIHPEELAAAPEFSELWPEISARLCGTPLIAHNCSTERTVLTKMAPMTQFGPWIDTLVYARARYPGLPSYALGDMVETFGLTEEVERLCPGRAWHDALYDACACAALAARFMSEGVV